MFAEALERIEVKIAFLERANSELSDVVIRQQRDIETLRAKIAVLTARMQASSESEITQRTPEDERPPHY
ncbi:MAG: SlyX family protein [Steroidobacteraceae bacterium]